MAVTNGSEWRRRQPCDSRKKKQLKWPDARKTPVNYQTDMKPLRNKNMNETLRELRNQISRA